jgi:hypothetical protein
MPDIIEVNITTTNNTVEVNVITQPVEVVINRFDASPGAIIIVSETEPPNPEEGLLWAGPL